MSALKDILNHDEELSSEELVRYLEGKLSEEERHAIERKMADSDFLSEAVEGLEQFDHPQHAAAYAEQLNRQLQQLTQKKNRRRLRRKLADNNWLTIAILGILSLCILGFLIVHFATRH
jgi:ferric-dicitrate binding protein FerR (iron transport regulator)